LKNDKYAKALTEVYSVLQNSEKEIQDLIPEEFKKFVIDNMEKEYEVAINFDNENWDNCILEETQAILAMIYRDYIVSKEEKKKLVEEELREEARIEQELREKYNTDNIFKKNISIEKNTNTIEDTSITTTKEKWYKKLFDNIKKIFGKFK